MDNSDETKTGFTSPQITSPIVQPSIVKKSILPWSILLMGVTALIFLGVVIGNVVPQLVNLIANMGGGPDGFLLLLPLNLIVGVYIAQVFYGFSLISKQKKQGGLDPLQRKWALIFFFLGVLAGIAAIPTIIYSLINPIYAVMDTLK